jgi:alkylation response protein AidB-like acyl-CoA dehydrogenase
LDFQLTPEQQRLQSKCRELAADFATRSAAHDRDASHPVENFVAEMSADLEAARLITYHSAWLSDKEGPTAKTTAALYRAKYRVGEAVSRITRTALTLSGAHGIFKTSRLEQLFRDGALGPLHPPPSDFCLYNMGLYELSLDPTEVLPPLRPG